jgi:hypothetical protein
LTGVAVKVTLVPEHIGFWDAATETLTGRLGFTVMLTVLEVAGLPDAQPSLDVRTQLTISPFTKVEVVKVLLFEPTLPPFSFHWYVGEEPPFVGVAVNVTSLPWQTGFAEGAIVIPTATIELTVIVTAFEVAGLPETQFALEVKTQVTTSLFTRDDVEKVLLFVPVLVPFNNHW